MYVNIGGHSQIVPMCDGKLVSVLEVYNVIIPILY